MTWRNSEFHKYWATMEIMLLLHYHCILSWNRIFGMLKCWPGLVCYCLHSIFLAGETVAVQHCKSSDPWLPPDIRWQRVPDSLYLHYGWHLQQQSELSTWWQRDTGGPLLLHCHWWHHENVLHAEGWTKRRHQCAVSKPTSNRTEYVVFSGVFSHVF